MSKYTTQVRFICENKSDLENSGGSDNVDAVIAGAWDKIFTSKVAFFDENYRSVLCQKILKHYYLREICCETVGIWKLWMNERLETIMPYYNQLYKSELIEFNPMYDVDVTRKHNRSDDSTSTTGSESTKTSKTTITNTNDNKKLFSDTPQGGISGIESMTYLTDATLTSGTENSTESNSGNSQDTTNSNIQSTEDFLESVNGKQGTESYSSLLLKYRETFLNIDMQVIEEFNDLFFGLW